MTETEQAEPKPFTYHFDADLGCQVHDDCGGPIVGSTWQMFCLKCRPDLLDFEHGGVSKWLLRWLRDNDMLDALIDEELADASKESAK